MKNKMKLNYVFTTHRVDLTKKKRFEYSKCSKNFFYFNESYTYEH